MPLPLLLQREGLASVERLLQHLPQLLLEGSGTSEKHHRQRAISLRASAAVGTLAAPGASLESTHNDCRVVFDWLMSIYAHNLQSFETVPRETLFRSAASNVPH